MFDNYWTQTLGKDPCFRCTQTSGVLVNGEETAPHVHAAVSETQAHRPVCGRETFVELLKHNTHNPEQGNRAHTCVLAEHNFHNVMKLSHAELMIRS